jgi:hypothetical protein
MSTLSPLSLDTNTLFTEKSIRRFITVGIIMQYWFRGFKILQLKKMQFYSTKLSILANMDECSIISEIYIC